MAEGDPNLFKFSNKYLPAVALVPEVQKYLEEHSIRFTPDQVALEKEVLAHRFGALSSSRDGSHFLGWLVGTLGVKKVIEVGVFLGATTLAIAQNIPADGKIVALDNLEEFTSIGQKYWKQAGVEHKIDLKIRPAVESLKELTDDHKNLNSFDFAFIDADKINYDSYYEYCLKLVRPGGVVAVDNVLWLGKVVQGDVGKETQAIWALNVKIRTDPRVAIAMLAISDGLTLCRKL
eukprot:Phypoly_transcript_17804.p1 GENE.Phypoly_transcript_17804~~Phypoly_transcript_17804.p1  ORF type:complete len:259 (+),score=45.39 Phypoly_transcript_17804:78-779(+)